MNKLLDWLIGGYVILLPIQFKLGIFRYAPSDTFLFIILICSALGLVRLKIRPKTWSFWHFGIILSFMISTLVAVLPKGYLTQYAVFNKDIGLLILFASYAVLISYAENWERIRRVLRLLVISVTLQNILCVIGFFAVRMMGVPLTFLLTDNTRLNGLLVDPNAYGGLLVMAVGIHMITYFRREPLVGGFMGILVTMTLAMGVLLTYSRSAWIGLVALLLLMMVNSPKAGLSLTALGFGSVYGILRIMGPQYLNEMSQMSFRQTQVLDRIELIRRSIPMFWQSPIFGIGVGVFWDRWGVIIHNTPVWILTEFGLFGFTMYAGFMCWFLLRGMQAYRAAQKAEKAIIAGLLASNLVMIGLSMGVEATYQRHWWLILALIAASYRLTREKHTYVFRRSTTEPAEVLTS